MCCVLWIKWRHQSDQSDRHDQRMGKSWQSFRWVFSTSSLLLSGGIGGGGGNI